MGVKLLFSLGGGINKIMAIVVAWPFYIALISFLAFMMGWAVELYTKAKRESSLQNEISAIPSSPQVIPHDIIYEIDIDEEFEDLIKYSSKIKNIYKKYIENLPFEWRVKFKKKLIESDDASGDVELINNEILMNYVKSINPFDSEEANFYFKYCREKLGVQYGERFKTLYGKLGPSANPREIAEKLHDQHRGDQG